MEAQARSRVRAPFLVPALGEHINCKQWLADVSLSSRVLAPFRPVATQWFPSRPTVYSSSQPQETIEDKRVTLMLRRLEVEEKITRGDNQRLKNELYQLKAEHSKLMQRTKEVVNELTQVQSQGPSQNRRYGDTTITQGAMAVVGDIVQNYIFQSSYRRQLYDLGDPPPPSAIQRPHERPVSVAELRVESINGDYRRPCDRPVSTAELRAESIDSAYPRERRRLLSTAERRPQRHDDSHRRTRSHSNNGDHHRARSSSNRSHRYKVFEPSGLEGLAELGD